MVVIVEAHILVGSWWPRGSGVEGSRGQLLIRCQKVKENSTMEEVCKKGTDIMRFRHNEVNSEATFDDHQNTSKCS